MGIGEFVLLSKYYGVGFYGVVILLKILGWGFRVKLVLSCFLVWLKWWCFVFLEFGLWVSLEGDSGWWVM